MTSKWVKWTLAAGLAGSAFGLTYAAQPSTVQHAQAISTMYSTTDHLNIRTGPSKKYRVVGQFNENDAIQVLRSYTTTWYQISYKGTKRYVHKAYVAKEPIHMGTGFVTTATGVNLNIRSGPSTGYKIIGKMPSRAAFKVIDFRDGFWYKIYYKGKVGYVNSAYTYIYH